MIINNRFPRNLYFKFKVDLANITRKPVPYKKKCNSAALAAENKTLQTIAAVWRASTGDAPARLYCLATGMTREELKPAMRTLCRRTHDGTFTRPSLEERRKKIHKIADQKLPNLENDMENLKIVERGPDLPKEKPELPKAKNLNSKMADLCEYYRHNPDINFEELADAYRGEIIKRHRAEWLEHAMLFDLGEIMASNNTAAARQAKLLAETIKLRQDGERLAWGIDNYENRNNVNMAMVPPIINIVGVHAPEKTEKIVSAPMQELINARQEQNNGD